MARKVIKGRGGVPPGGRKPPPPPGNRGQKPIIEKEVVSAKKKGMRIIAEAEERAQAIIDEANELAQETHKRGFEEGKQEGLAQYTKEIAGALDQVNQMQAAMEPVYIDLIVQCVEKIIDQELKVNPDVIVGIVRNALKDAGQQREIIVRVNSEDAESLRKNSSRLLEVLARANNVEVREDPSIKRGGCIIGTELGTIDATLDRQLPALQKALQIELEEGPADFAEYDEYEDEEGY